jgi:hypothetical protein
VDAGNPEKIGSQWTWKPSPRSIGLDADENGQPRQVQHQIPIYPVYGGFRVGPSLNSSHSCTVATDGFDEFGPEVWCAMKTLNVILNVNGYIFYRA